MPFPHPSLLLQAAPRCGRVRFPLLGVIGLLAVVGLAGYFWWQPSQQPLAETTLTHRVASAEFEFEITERGELKSTGNTEIRCEVKAREKGSTTTILRIVPEGTMVEEGDFLVEFDSSALELEKLQQEIAVNTSRALLEEVKNLYDTALIAKDEYLKGTFVQESEEIQTEILLAEEDYRRAEEYFEYSKRLVAKGYITELQLEADQFAVEKARTDLASKQTKLNVLEKYTREKEATRLTAEIKSAEAKLRAEEASYQLEEAKLTEIEEQLLKCLIHSPIAGQVKYAHKRDYRGDDDVVIEPGADVREQQEVIYLPDRSAMECEIEINEALVDFVRAGMSASVRLVGLPDAVLPGTVRKVNEYAEPSSWRTSGVKEYAAFVTVDIPDERMRTGMTAEVTVHVEHLPSALQVPVQALLSHGRDVTGEDRYYCIRRAGTEWEARRVTRGSTNDRFAVIESGIVEGDQVSLDPRKLVSQVELPVLSAYDRQQAVRPAVRSEHEKTADTPTDKPAETAEQQETAPKETKEKQEQGVGG